MNAAEGTKLLKAIIYTARGHTDEASRSLGLAEDFVRNDRCVNAIRITEEALSCLEAAIEFGRIELKKLEGGAA